MRRSSPHLSQYCIKLGVSSFRRAGVFILPLVFVALYFLPTRSFCQSVDMALVLVIDTSGSIDPSEYALQFAGYAAAFKDPAAIEAMTSGPNKAIAVDVLVFSDSVTRVMGWEIVHDKDSSLRVANLMENAPRVQIGGTFLAQALNAAIMELADCPFIPGVSTIDVSGDGPDNEGQGPVAAVNIFDVLQQITGKQTSHWSQQLDNNAYRLRELRDHVQHKGININCVAIQDPGMKGYFEKNVMSGNASFTLFASSFQTFATVIQKKILREIREGIKLSVSRESSNKGPTRSVTKPGPSAPAGDVKTKEREKPKAASSGADDELSLVKQVPPPTDMNANALPGQKSMSSALPPDMTRSIRFTVRDADSLFPLNEIKIGSASANSLPVVEDVGACPGQMMATVVLKEKRPVELSISAAGYEAKTFTVSQDTPERCDIRLTRLPMKIVW